MPPNACKNAQIVDAAIAEFEERGFEGATMDRIASRAGVSKRTVYNHFESKEALFNAILDRMIEQASAVTTITYDPARPFREQLLELGRAEGRLLRTPSFIRLARLANTESLRNPALAAAVSARMEHKNLFGAFFAAAATAGALETDDPQSVATQFIGMIKSQAFWPVTLSGEMKSAAEIERIIAASVETIIRAYGA